MNKWCIIVLLILFNNSITHSQSGITADDCLDKLDALQSKKEGFYPKGTFPTQRFWLSANGEEDNNVFSTACIAYTLRNANRRAKSPRVESLINNSIISFENYRSRRGEAAYNHWQTTGDDLPFPNSKLLARESLRLPDDYDDTAVIQLARGSHKMDLSVRNKMVKYAMRENRKPVDHFPSDHKSKKVFEVWYADKMQQELDVTVMANVLLFVFERGYTLEQPDLDTIECLKTSIDDQWYFTDPQGFSPYYNRAPLILYSLARVIALDPNDHFTTHKPKLIQHLRQALPKNPNTVDQLMIASSLLRLGEEVTITISQKKLEADIKSFVFFSYESPALAMRLLPEFIWKCEAMGWALTYEFLHFAPNITWTN